MRLRRSPNWLKRLFLALFFCGLTFFSLFSTVSKPSAEVGIIPRPWKIEVGRVRLSFSEKSAIIINQKEPLILSIAEELQAGLKKATGWPWEIKEAGQTRSLRGAIFLRLLPSVQKYGPEGYELQVSSSHVVIDAAEAAGLFYGVQTLWQLLPPAIEFALASQTQSLDNPESPNLSPATRQSSPLPIAETKPKSEPSPLLRYNLLPDLASSPSPSSSPLVSAPESAGHGSSLPTASTAVTSLSLPQIHIVDKPRFRWRGVHLDSSRHFFPKEWVKKLIDLAAYYKLNTFHWHLTDDQGWRLEVKKYPRLTEVGAWRRETMEDGEPYGGFYTQEDIKEVVDYARRRFITIVPEIEMPGHSLAALAAYPELSCTGGPFKVGTEWGVMNDVFCAGSEETFTFLENVLAEVSELFPGEFIHIGGDEVPKLRWKNCVRCQARIKAEGLKDESELQSYFIKRVEAFLHSRGRRLIGWDEILEGGLAPRATVMSWRGVAGGIEAARSGHDVVMSPTSHCYFDYYQGRVEEPKAIGGFLPIDKVYSFEPIPPGLKPEEAAHILGAQANLWTEYIATPEHAEYMLFPRLWALAEVVWSLKEKNWADFENRLRAHYDRLALRGVNYRVPPPEGIGGRKRLTEKITLTLSPPVIGARILYTLDGPYPGPDSLIYTYPIDILGNMTLRAATQLPNGRMSHPVSMYFFQVDEAVNGLAYDYYEGNWERLPDLTKETPLRSGLTYELTLEGIPTRGDYFALRFHGWLELDESGEYIFYTRADDGLQVKIDDQVVVDNWGLFGQRELNGKIFLAAGRHRLEVEYLEKRGGQYLEVFISGPGLPYQPLPPSRLYRE